MFLAPNFFWGECPPNFCSGIIKYSQIPNMWQSFRAIGRGSSENAWRNKKTSAVKHKPVRNGYSGRPKNQQYVRILGLHDSCPKNYQNTRIFMIFARKMYKIPEFSMIFARKIPEFYVIIARRGGVLKTFSMGHADDVITCFKFISNRLLKGFRGCGCPKTGVSRSKKRNI